MLPVLPPRTFAWTVSSELIGFFILFCLIFFVSGPCARLSWRLLAISSAFERTLIYRIVSYRIPNTGRT